MVTDTTIKKGLPDETSVKAGYKQTDLGVIPEDWSVIKLGDYVVITSGESPSKFMMQDEGIPYFKVEQLNNCTKYQEDTPYHIKGRKKVKSGSILFPKRGAAIFLNKIRLLKQDSYFDTNLMALTVNDELSSEFLFYSINYLGLDKVADTTSVPQINNKHITPFILPVPSKKEEQTAIATVLSDTDVLIEHLKRLIAKKKAIKQGAMQQLLTGKKRLPGFSGEWEVKKLGEVMYLQGGYAFKSQFFIEIGVSIIRISDVGNDKVDTNNSVCYKPFNIPKDFIAVKGDVLIAMSGATTGKIGVYQEDKLAYINQRVGKFVILNQEKTSLQFVSHIVRSEKFKEKLQKEIAQGAQPNISGKQIESIKLSIPQTKSEQTAIATILSDMDAEIESLEQKRDKYTMLNQGMMQQLLTGRIRIYANN